MEKFQQFKLNDEVLNAAIGGNRHLDNCISSIDGACDASCGSGDCNYWDCYNSQLAHCYAVLG